GKVAMIRIGVDLARHPAFATGSLRRRIGHVERRDTVFVDEPLDGGIDLIGIHDGAEIVVPSVGPGADTLRWNLPTFESAAFPDGGVRASMAGDLIEEVANMQALVAKEIPLRERHQCRREVRALGVGNRMRPTAVVQWIGSDDLTQRAKIGCVYRDGQMSASTPSIVRFRLALCHAVAPLFVVPISA